MSTKPLQEIASLFLKLGFIAFGGPAVHIAMMEREVVSIRGWMSHESFLDLVGATNLIPGPNSTEMALHCGYLRGGAAGLVVAGICFITPAVLLTTLFAYLYFNYGHVPAIEPLLYGIKPAAIALVLGALYKLGHKAILAWHLGLIGIAVVAGALLGLDLVLLILAAGIVGIVVRFAFRSLSAFSAPLWLALVAGSDQAISLLKLFLVFLKIGAVLFGSGYVLVAYLEADLVNSLGWLTYDQLLDAIAIGQFTPGPVLSTATFIGYQMYGITGAVICTIGIFTPSFFFVLISNPFIPRLRNSKWSASFLDSVNVASLGVMAAVTISLGAEVLVDYKSWLIVTLSALAVVFRPSLSSVWIIVAASILGYVLSYI